MELRPEESAGESAKRTMPASVRREGRGRTMAGLKDAKLDPVCTGATCALSCPAPDFRLARRGDQLTCIE